MKLWLNKDECLSTLGIPESLFDALIAAELLPEGVEYSRRTVLWERRVIEAAGVLLPGLLKALAQAEATEK